MHFSELIQASWRIYRRNRIMLILSAIIAAVTAYFMLAPSGNSKNYAILCGYSCFSFLLLFFLAFIETGLIQVVNRDQTGQATTRFLEVWQTFRSRFSLLALVSVIAIAVFVFFFIILELVIVLVTAFLPRLVTSYFLSTILILITIVMIPLLLMTQFAYRAIVMESNKLLDSISNGLKILAKNFGQALLIFMVYAILQTLLQAIVSIAYYSALQLPELGSLVHDDLYTLYVALMLSPAARILVVLVTSVLFPIYSISLSLIYLRSMKAKNVIPYEMAVG